MANYNTEIRRKSINNSGIKIDSSNISIANNNEKIKQKDNKIQDYRKPGIINNTLLIENKKGRFLRENLV